MGRRLPHAGAVSPEPTLERAMLNDRNPHWVYTQTIKMFAAPASPPFEDEPSLSGIGGECGASTTMSGRSAAF
jgi:hypothetical protein